MPSVGCLVASPRRSLGRPSGRGVGAWARPGATAVEPTERAEGGTNQPRVRVRSRVRTSPSKVRPCHLPKDARERPPSRCKHPESRYPPEPFSPRPTDTSRRSSVSALGVRAPKKTFTAMTPTVPVSLARLPGGPKRERRAEGSNSPPRLECTQYTHWCPKPGRAISIPPAAQVERRRRQCWSRVQGTDAWKSTHDGATQRRQTPATGSDLVTPCRGSPPGS